MRAWRKTGPALVGETSDDDLRILCPSVASVVGGLRLFYMGFGRGSPAGSRGRILSAWSSDGEKWTPEPGVRLGNDRRWGTEIRALSPTIVSLGARAVRMYFEAVGAGGTSVRSAISADGVAFRCEPGERVRVGAAKVGSPRALVLPDGRVRLYVHVYPSPFKVGLERGNHVVSFAAADGLAFEPESGIRVRQTLPGREDEAVYAAQPVPLADGRVRLFYAAWNGASAERGAILSALSTDGGLTFVKDPTPAIAPDGPLDAGFASEPCVFQDPAGAWRMVYEAADLAGRTRILGAILSDQRALA